VTRDPDATLNMRVLVVDDETDFLDTYVRLLRRQGYDVSTASSLATALVAIAREPPSLVISDLKLPDGDGLEVVRAACSVANPPPVIVVTGHPSEEQRVAAMVAGATAFFAKPFIASALLAAVRSSQPTVDRQLR
jgi:DNA-binding response OmpR family regulator